MKALYVAASGMAAQQVRLDTVANNIANVGTTGYKRSREAFQDLFYQELAYGGKSAARAARIEVGGGVQLAGVTKDHRAGDLKNTGEPLHVAIEGDAMFVLEDPEGARFYSRDGSFRLDAEGLLVTAGGLAVAGDIVIPEEATRVLVLPDGTVQAQLDQDTELTTLGRIELATFVNPAGLRPMGGNLFEETPESGEAMVARPEDARVRQGFLEASNVDVASELIEMILAQRAFELNSKVVQAADETLSVAVNLRR